MKFAIVFAAILAVSSAQFLTSDFGAVVRGAKAVIAGPSGTISADTGAIVKSPLATGVVAPLATRFIDPVAPRLIGAPLIGSSILGARSFIDSPLLHRGLYTPGLVGTRSLYGDYLL